MKSGIAGALLGAFAFLFFVSVQIKHDLRDGKKLIPAVVLFASDPGAISTDKNVKDSMSLMQLLVEAGVQFPEVVIAQSLLETGFYSSQIYLENKNPFGMKTSSRGFHIPTNSWKHKQYCYDKVHACYINYRYAVKDFKEWQSIRLKAYTNYFGRTPSSVDEYLHFLDNLVINKKIYRYAEDPQYTKKVAKILQRWNKTAFFSKTIVRSSDLIQDSVFSMPSTEVLELRDTIRRYPKGPDLIVIYKQRNSAAETEE